MRRTPANLRASAGSDHSWPTLPEAVVKGFRVLANGCGMGTPGLGCGVDYAKRL